MEALEARIPAAPSHFLPAEADYIDPLKPTSFFSKAGALIFADLLVIAVTWMSRG